MEAYCKCPKFGCAYPGCDRLMKIMDRVLTDRFGNQTYTACCDKVGEVISGIRESEIIRPPDRKDADVEKVEEIIKGCASAIGESVAAFKANGKDRYLALDPNQFPLLTSLASLTEDFVLSSATDAEWHLMKCHSRVYHEWMCRFDPVRTGFGDLFEVVNAEFPNAVECADAERKCLSLFDRIYYHGCENYIGSRKGLDKRSIADFYKDFIDALSRLSYFVKSKDKPFTKSGRKVRKPPKQKRGPKITSEQETQIASGLNYCKDHPGKWAAAARHALTIEAAKVKNKAQTDGYIAHSSDYKTAVASIARAIERAAKAKPKR